MLVDGCASFSWNTGIRNLNKLDIISDLLTISDHRFL